MERGLSFFPDHQIKDFDIFLEKQEIKKISKNSKKSKKSKGKNKDNLTKKGKEALTALNKNEEIVIRAANKGGGIVVMDYNIYHKEALNILLDPVHYEKISGNPFPEVKNQFRDLLKRCLTNNLLTKDEYRSVNIMVPNDPFFYFLPKIHKDQKNDHLRH